jgi:uncharacterized protein YfaQ (DUF2300 family)
MVLVQQEIRQIRQLDPSMVNPGFFRKPSFWFQTPVPRQQNQAKSPSTTSVQTPCASLVNQFVHSFLSFL